jgi:hypothetical protein
MASATRLAVLKRDYSREFVAPRRHEIERAAKDLGAFARMPCRPVLHSSVRGVDRCKPVRFHRRGHGSQFGLIGRIDHIEAPAIRSGSPFPVDIEVCPEHRASSFQRR